MAVMDAAEIGTITLSSKIIMNKCACGCGKETKKENSRFLRGHWQKTPEGRKRMSKTQKGENNSFYNKKHTEKFKKTHKKRFSGKNNPMYAVEREKGSDAANWKGGRYIDSEGFVNIYKPDHPRASAGGKYVFEHILIAEEVLGRPLRINEQVHHINFHRSDNRRENLVICSRSYHAFLHHRIRKKGLKNHFRKKK